MRVTKKKIAPVVDVLGLLLSDKGRRRLTADQKNDIQAVVRLLVRLGATADPKKFDAGILAATALLCSVGKVRKSALRSLDPELLERLLALEASMAKRRVVRKRKPNDGDGKDNKSKGKKRTTFPGPMKKRRTTYPGPMANKRRAR